MGGDCDIPQGTGEGLLLESSLPSAGSCAAASSQSQGNHNSQMQFYWLPLHTVLETAFMKAN